MAKLSCRTLVLTLVATLSILVGCSNSLQACCLSWLSGCFGGGCGTYGGAAYSAGYYGGGYGDCCSTSYYGGYAASFDNCNSCGYVGGNVSSPSGCCSGGCSSCESGDCGVNFPAATTPQTPADRFEEGTGRDRIPRSTPSGTDRIPNGTNRDRRRTPRSETIPPVDRKPATRIPPRENEGFPGDPDAVEPEGTPANGGLDEGDRFDQPLRQRGSGEGPAGTRKPPMPEMPAEDTPKVPETEENPDAFPTDDPEETSSTTTKRPVLGNPSSKDDVSSDKSVIPTKEPAPIDIPADPEPEAPADANPLNLDDANSTSPITPKSRLALKSRFGNPTVARIRLRPDHKWIAVPTGAKLAKH